MHCRFLTLAISTYFYPVDQVRATATVHALIESRGHAFTQSDTHAVQEQLTALLASIQAEVEDTADNTATCFNIIP